MVLLLLLAYLFHSRLCPIRSLAISFAVGFEAFLMIKVLVRTIFMLFLFIVNIFSLFLSLFIDILMYLFTCNRMKHKT